MTIDQMNAVNWARFMPYCTHAYQPKDESGAGGGRQQYLDLDFVDAIQEKMKAMQ
jgi:hypothetical protein